MTAEKGNKVYKIDEAMKARYLADGFDIKDDDGHTTEYGQKQVIPFGEYERACKEIERLQALLTELQTGTEPEREKETEKDPEKKVAGKK